MEETHLAEPTHDECTLAALAHFLQIISWWIAPLVIYVVKRESRFVSFHALQALIYQVLCTVMSMLMMVVWMGGMLVMTLPGTATEKASKGPPTFFFIVFGLFMLFWVGLWVLTFVLAIVYGIKASRGEWAAYPIIGRWARRFAGIHKDLHTAGT
jgi:uncharacterized Tic20 family protein